eukprot:comp7150_c0_seq1/m.2872 comp7150_c0_seq1/g.2872  ORF comp7150_c0_seq1/g.2872 comp7150_c0_seq1/m.2872 type:complete len:305 (-) comp7150_c0_seq1:432-1346(-)
MSLRWAFDVAAWQPTAEQLAYAIACIQPEEKERISRFVYQKDARLALAGRLLLRRAAGHRLGIGWEDIALSRTKANKPYVANEVDDEAKGYSFNVAHHGNFTVLAAEKGRDVGVDVMTFDPPDPPETVDSLLALMRPQLSDNEWDEIYQSQSPLEHFYRIWTLKEAYIKAVGLGLQIDLGQLDFHQSNPMHLRRRHENFPSAPFSQLETSAVVHVNGTKIDGWTFEQSYLDDDHCVCVGLAPVKTRAHTQRERGDDEKDVDEREHVVFEVLSFEKVIEGATPLGPLDLTYTQKMLAKPMVHVCR